MQLDDDRHGSLIYSIGRWPELVGILFTVGVIVVLMTVDAPRGHGDTYDRDPE